MPRLRHSRHEKLNGRDCAPYSCVLQAHTFNVLSAGRQAWTMHGISIENIVRYDVTMVSFSSSAMVIHL